MPTGCHLENLPFAHAWQAAHHVQLERVKLGQSGTAAHGNDRAGTDAQDPFGRRNRRKDRRALFSLGMEHVTSILGHGRRCR
jgi:hypothetical protein